MTDLKTPQERVVEFLDARKGVYYSPVTLSKRLGIKRRLFPPFVLIPRKNTETKDGNLAGTGRHNINLFYL